MVMSMVLLPNPLVNPGTTTPEQKQIVNEMIIFWLCSDL